MKYAKRVLCRATDQSGRPWALVENIDGEIAVKDESADFGLYISPSQPMGWMWDFSMEQAVSIESYGNFGRDAAQSKKAANEWRLHALDMYYVLCWRLHHKSH